MAAEARQGTGLRLRLTLLATVVVAGMLAVASVGLVVTQRRLLTRSIDDTVRQRADDLAALVASGQVPPTLSQAGDDDTLAQVVTAEGEILASSRNLDGEPPIAPAPPEAGPEQLRTGRPLALEDDPYRLLSRRIDGPDGPVILHVASALDDMEESLAALRASLLVVVPVLSLLMAALTWWLVGWTLRPVEVANRRQQRFVADASHELRSPLTRMRSELEVDLAHPGTADLAATHRSLLEETIGLQRLVDDLLHLARTGRHADVVRQEPVDLDDILLSEAHRLRENGRISVDTTEISAAQILGDREQLARALRNIVDNAARHAASQVVLRLAERGQEAVLEVVDDGPGIPANDRERVFERFTRLDNARSQSTGGAGLGLAITRDIVERHRGAVFVASHGRPGTCVRVRLPSATWPRQGART